MATAQTLDRERGQVTLADIQAAHARIAPSIVRTPCLESITLSQLTGARVFLKFENLQFTAAYKERGALNKLLLLSEEERARGVIAASAGNHSQGLSFHARRLGIPATIVMPRHTPIVKVQQTLSHQPEVILEGDNFDEAYAFAVDLGRQRGLTFIHPFDDAAVYAGQGTVALEMLEDAPDIDTLIVPIGGGGLISGMATAAKALRPDIAVVGVQAELYPSMYAKLNGVDLLSDGDTLAEGIAVKQPGALTFEVVRRLVDSIVLVAERDLESAVSMLLQIEKTVVEGAGAAGLAALLAHRDQFQGKTVGLVLCGGNIDTRLLTNVLLRDLVRSGRMARLRLRMQDRPGALYNASKVFLENQVNIIEVSHQRIFSTLPAKGLITDIECETRDREHLNRLILALEDAGFEVTPVEPL